eukprot:2894869-Amphidinium_carterae.1
MAKMCCTQRHQLPTSIVHLQLHRLHCFVSHDDKPSADTMFSALGLNFGHGSLVKLALKRHVMTVGNEATMARPKSKADLLRHRRVSHIANPRTKM